VTLPAGVQCPPGLTAVQIHSGCSGPGSETAAPAGHQAAGLMWRIAEVCCNRKHVKMLNDRCDIVRKTTLGAARGCHPLMAGTKAYQGGYGSNLSYFVISMGSDNVAAAVSWQPAVADSAAVLATLLR